MSFSLKKVGNVRVGQMFDFVESIGAMLRSFYQPARDNQ